MKTAEEILKDCGCNSKREIIEAMKIYANQKLDEAAEKAKAQLTSNTEAVWHTDFWAEVDKQSILNLKDEL